MRSMVPAGSCLLAAGTGSSPACDMHLELSFLTEESTRPKNGVGAEGGQVSAISAVGAGGFRRRRGPQTAPVVRGLVLATITLDLLIVVFGAVFWNEGFREAGWGLVAWIAVVAAVGAASLSFESGQALALDMPVLLSVGYLFGPIVAGATAFVAYIDPRELRGEIPVDKGLFNRAQTSLSVMAATGIFAVVIRAGEGWPIALFAAFLAVGADCLINYGTVVSVLCLHERIRPLDGFSRLYFGSLPQFALTYASFGLLSLMLAEVYKSVGAWSLLVFLIPVLLARQAFVGNKRLARAGRRLEAQAEALRDVAVSMADERRDERLSLAAGLHDEVLPPLFRVHLMGQVLRQELASGQLLALEEDLPALLSATETASESMRVLIRSLRDSPLGTGGLAETLRLLVRYMEQESTARIALSCEPVGGTPLVQLLAYQVAREALRNALRHSKASEVMIGVVDQDGDLRITVEDDGIGFDPRSVDQKTHFGLALMRERIEIAGGMMYVDSRIGEGTRIIARLPSTKQERRGGPPRGARP
jgi:signal transduction histidine kinase